MGPLDLLAKDWTCKAGDDIKERQ